MGNVEIIYRGIGRARHYLRKSGLMLPRSMAELEAPQRQKEIERLRLTFRTIAYHILDNFPSQTQAFPIAKPSMAQLGKDWDYLGELMDYPLGNLERTIGGGIQFVVGEEEARDKKDFALSFELQADDALQFTANLSPKIKKPEEVEDALKREENRLKLALLFLKNAKMVNPEIIRLKRAFSRN